MEAFKKVFSPGHNVDDELMYGSGSTKKTNETSREIDAQKSRTTPSGPEGTAAQSSAAPASDLAPSVPPKVHHNASTTSIRSGVLGSDHQDSQMTSPTSNTHSAADTSNNPTSYPTGAHPKDFAAQGNPQASSGFDRSRDEAAATPSQTTMSSSYPRGAADTSNEPRSHPSTAHPTTFATRSHPQANPDLTGPRNERDIVGGQTNYPGAQSTAAGGNTSGGLDREYHNPTSHQQQESTTSGRQAGLAGGAALAAAGYAGTRDDSRNTSARQERYPNPGGMAMGEESQSQSRYSMPGQFPMSDPYNPYSSSHLDPRVDPYSTFTGRSNAPPIGAAITTGRDPTDRSAGYGSSMENSGLSGTKTTARPFDGPKGTTAPLPGPKGTSEPLGERSYQAGPDATTGAAAIADHQMKTPIYDAVTVGGGSNSGFGSPIAADRSDFNRTSDSGLPKPSVAADRSEPSRTAAFGTGNLPTAGERSEPTHSAESGVGTSAIERPEHDSHKKEKSGLLGAIGLGSHRKSRDHDESIHREPSHAGVAGSTSAAERSEPPYPTHSNIRTSDPVGREDDDHTKHKSGLLGAIGIGSHAKKSHTDDVDKPSHATVASPTIADRTEPTLDREDDDHKKHKSGLLGAIGIGSHAKKPHTDDVDKPSHATVASPTIADRPEPTQATHSGVRTSETIAHDDGDNKGKKGGLLGAIGIGSHSKKSHTHDADEPSHAGIASPTGAERAAPHQMTHSGARTSETIDRQEDDHKGKKGGFLGALGLGSHGAKSRTHHDDTPNEQASHGALHDPTTSTGMVEPTQVTGSDGRNSEPRPEDDSHKARNAGIIGAIGLGGLAAKKHGEDHPERPTGTMRESIPTTAYPPGTTLSDRSYPEGPVGDHAGIPTRAHDAGVAPVGGHAATHRGHDSGAAPTHRGNQPSTITGPMNTQPGAGTGVMTGPSTTTPGSTSPSRPEDDHTARNTTIGGATAVGASAASAQQYSLHQAKEEAEERLRADHAHQKAVEESQKAAEKEQKLHDKALAKEEKQAEREHEKMVKKEEKEHEKAVKKEEKEQEKLVKKEEKAAEKEHIKAVKHQEKVAEKEQERAIKHEEKLEKEHEKELAKQEKRQSTDEKDNKKHGLLGLFKRHRDSTGNEIDSDDQSSPTTTPVIPSGHESGQHVHLDPAQHHEMNKLHKDPPPQVLEKLQNQLHSQNPNPRGNGDDTLAGPAYTDYPVREDGHPGATTVLGGSTVPPHQQEDGSMINRPRGVYDT